MGGRCPRVGGIAERGAAVVDWPLTAGTGIGLLEEAGAALVPLSCLGISEISLLDNVSLGLRYEKHP